MTPGGPCCSHLSTKMAPPATNVSFEVGEIVIYKQRYYEVEAITKPLGYNLYDIVDLVSREKHRTFHYMLDKVDAVDVVTCDWNIEVETDLDATQNQTPFTPAEPGSYFPTSHPPLWRFQSQTTSTTGTGTAQVGSSSDTETPAQPQAKRPRHADVNEVDLDKLAGARLSKHTEEQTQWGVRILKGTYWLLLEVHTYYF